MNTEPLVFERTIHAPVEQVYQALTNSTALREWLCDAATTDPHPGGRVYLWWNNGYYSCGEFLNLVNGQEVAFSWLGRGDPGATRVEITLVSETNSTRLKLVHAGLGNDEAWTAIAQRIHKGWESSLNNLAHTLEVGPDLRITTRPMMGFYLDDYNETIAHELGVPVTLGVRIANVIDGMGAQAAGLQKNDVIVGLAGHPVTDYASLTAAMQNRKAGEEVQMIYYRGAEKISVTMKLSPRPIPEIPPTPAELAAAVKRNYAQMETDLDAFLQGVSEEEASARPNPAEWSIKGVLAHLIHGERGWQNTLGEIITSAEASYDEFGGNPEVRIDATLAAYPSLNDLVTELKRLFVETLAIIANLPADFVARKTSYWRLGYQALQVNFHFQTHMEQMQATIQTIRQQ